MRTGRFVLASFAIFVTAIAWNGVVHLMILKQAEAAIRPIVRPDFGSKAWISLVATLAVSGLFVAGYGRIAKSGSLREGALYGLFFGVLAALLVDVNQYVLYPIPGVLAAKWSLAGALEFVVYGLLVTKLYPVTGDRQRL